MGIGDSLLPTATAGDDDFGFAEQPFSLTPDPRFFYRSASHGKALEELHRAIDRREGFMLLTGDIGTGKTTLCRTLLDQLGRKTFTALVLNPFVSEEELLKVILQDFEVVSREEVRRGALIGKSKQDLVDVLNQFLLSLDRLKASAVLVIDEAQNLPTSTLEQIRVLTNLETDRHKLLQILLVGQLNLLTVLDAPGMRQLNQRISRRCALQPLNRQETDAYVAHRLWVARGTLSVHFAPKAMDLVHRVSGGVPRTINLLCDRALEAGQATGTTEITPALVHQAAQALGLEAPRRRREDRRKATLRRWAPRLAVGAAAAAAIVVGAYQIVRYYDVTLWNAPPAQFSAGAPSVAAPVEAEASPGNGTSTPTTYSILTGAFATREAAEAAGERLKARGYLVVDIVPADGRNEYQLLIGHYNDMGLAREHADSLRQDTEFSATTIVTARAP